MKRAIHLSICATLALFPTVALADSYSGSGTIGTIELNTSSSTVTSHSGKIDHISGGYTTPYWWGGSYCSNYAGLSASMTQILIDAKNASKSVKIHYGQQGFYYCITGVTLE